MNEEYQDYEQDALEAAGHRYRFYQDGWRLMIVSIPLMVISILVLTIFLGLSILRDPKPSYFAVQNGQIVPMVPVSSPYVKPGDLNQWVARAVTESYMLDFQNFRTRLAENAKYFTPEGFEDYTNSLQKSGRMKMIQEGWFVGSAVPTDAPVIVSEGAVNGRYMWRLRMPVTVSYSSKTHAVPPQKLMLTIVVVRVDTRQNPYGIGISQIVERSA